MGERKPCDDYEGNDIDLSKVAEWFYLLYRNHNIRLWKCGYDQRFSKEWITAMENYGWMRTSNEDDSDIILILQNAQTLSNAMKLLEQDLRKQLVNYNRNKVDMWCFGNASIKVDQYGNCLCVRTEAAKKIDGAVTNIILYEMYRRYRTTFRTMIGGNK